MTSKENKERCRTRTCSSIDRLSAETRNEFELKLSDVANTYVEISEWLKEEGYNISKSAVGRYARRTARAAQRVADTLQHTQALARAVEANPDLDYTKAASIVLMDGLMQRVSSAEEDFEEMPLDKAGRLIASLSRNATSEKRVKLEAKKKSELAFDKMEDELLNAIKQHPELAGELRNVLLRAREKVIPDAAD